MPIIPRPALPAALLAAFALAANAPAPGSDDHDKTSAPEASGELFYIGMHGPDIRAARLDPVQGTARILGPVAQTDRPTWAVATPDGHTLYYANEAGNDGKGNGSVLAYHINPASGALSPIGTVDAQGGGTTNLALDPRTMSLFAANYGGGNVVSIPLRHDGTPEKVSA